MTIDPNACPAAHSMDTTWFAVDADGNIGVFDSGEAGGVPDTASTSMSPGGDDVDSFALDALRFLRVATREGARIDPIPKAQDARAGRRVIVVLDRARTSPTTYREHAGVGPFERSADDLWVLHESAPRLVATRSPLTEADAAALVADETVVGVVDEGDVVEWFRDDGDSGVFAWRNEDYEAAGAYVRDDAPAQPIRLDELPAPLADAIAATRIPTSFVDARALQLADHFAPGAIITYGDTDLVGPTEEEKAAREDEFQRSRAVARERGDRLARGMVYAVIAIVVFAFLAIWLSR